MESRVLRTESASAGLNHGKSPPQSTLFSQILKLRRARRAPATELIKVIYCRTSFEPSIVLGKYSFEMLTTLSGEFQSTLNNNSHTYLRLATDNATDLLPLYRSILKWMVKYWTYGRVESTSLKLKVPFVLNLMQVRDMATRLEIPILVDHCKERILNLIEIDFPIYRMAEILEWTNEGDGDWMIVVEAAAELIFKRRMFKAEFWEIFDMYERFAVDVKAAVEKMGYPDMIDEVAGLDLVREGKDISVFQDADTAMGDREKE